MTKISAKAFAQFLLGTTSQHLTTVRNLLKPQDPEAIIPQGYYKRGIKIIRAYHECGNRFSAVQDGIAALNKLLDTASSSQARTQLNKNIDAVHAYMRAFSERQWQVVSCPRCRYVFASISISGRPDLAVSDGGKTYLLKLGCRRKKEDVDLVRVMLRVIYQAAVQKLTISPSEVLYLDLTSGALVSGSDKDRVLAAAINDGCLLLERLVATGS